MSQTLPGGPATGPGRFGSAPDTQPTPLSHRIASASALAVLVVGVPVLLLTLHGAPPIPTGLPEREDLTGTIGIEQLLTVLVAVVWLAWLQFAACTALELRAALSGGILAPVVPLAGPTQRLVRALVGAALLSATVVGPSGAAVLDAPTVRPVAAVSTITAQTPDGALPAGHDLATRQHPGHDLATQQAGTAQFHGSRDDVTGVVGHRLITADPEQLADLVGRKVYVVQPPQGRHHDSLWEIAERHLGNGRRYHEIFQLNAGRAQPDGGTLHLARLIQPGWLLALPEDAVGVHRLALPPTAPAGPTTADDTLTGSSGDGTAAAGTASAGLGGQAGGTGGAGAAGHAVARSAPSGHTTWELGASGLLGAGLVAALMMTRRRRAGGTRPTREDAIDAEVWLRAGADPDRSRFLDRALRGLASGDRPLPGLYAAVLDDTGVELLLAPAAPAAPPPWTVLDGGTRWRLDRADALRSVTIAPCPWPGLISLGRDVSGRDILIDLSAAAGPICVTGSPTVSEHVLRAIAVELGTNPWSEDATVTGLGLPGELAGLAPGRLDLAGPGRTDQVLLAVEERCGVGRDEVLTGHRQGAADHICAANPHDPDLSDRLRTLADRGVAVITAGDLPGARWRLEVDDSGTLSVPALGLTVSANRIGDLTLARLHELFTAADTPPPEPDPDGRPTLPRPHGPADDADWAASPARIGILGPVCVRAPGALDPSRQDLASELLAHLALHPEGVHPTVLAGALWPRGVTPDVRDATIDRVGDWLGTLPDGTPRLRRDPRGKIALAPDVAVDWQVLLGLLHRSRRAQDPITERDLLHRALRLVRGPLLGGVEGGQYSWLARTGAERTVPEAIVDAAHRLAELCYEDDDAAAAGQAARCGLRGDATSQLLWCDLLRAEHAHFGSEGVCAAADDMEVLLADLGLRPEARTLALLEELAPHRTREEAGTATGS
ncbi:MAG: hypothetical protein QG608_408 [Actinomycetota bacterium]|nr:hypothetical protein [Actinomycetota bacterium]